MLDSQLCLCIVSYLYGCNILGDAPTDHDVLHAMSCTDVAVMTMISQMSLASRYTSLSRHTPLEFLARNSWGSSRASGGRYSFGVFATGTKLI